jgi:hypothetical protein
MWTLQGSIWSENNVEVKAFIYFILFMRVANCSTSVSIMLSSPAPSYILPERNIFLNPYIVYKWLLRSWSNKIIFIENQILFEIIFPYCNYLEKYSKWRNGLPLGKMHFGRLIKPKS